MGKPFKAAPEAPANVARMLPIGQGIEAPKSNNVIEVMETESPLVVDGNNNAVEPDSAPAPTPAPEPTPEKPVESGPTLPDKLKGKSPEEIAQMYLNAESELGRHRNEVGHMRKFVDQLLVNQGKLAQPQPPTPQVDEEAAKKQDIEELNLILTSPSKYRQKVKQELLGEISQIGQRTTMDRVRQEHGQVLTDPGFADWLVRNIPQKVAVEADRDPQVFQFVVNQYRAAANTQPQVQAPPPTVQAPPPGIAAGVGSNGKVGGKQVFSRTQMMELYNTNEAEYRRLLPDYMQAIQEKRVKP